MKLSATRMSVLIFLFICIVFINLMGWNVIGDIRINLVLTTAAVLALFIQDIGTLLSLFVLLLISIQWQPVIGKDILVLGGTMIAFLIARNYTPWLPVITLLVFIIVGTAIFFLILAPSSFLKIPSVILAEGVYNGGIGLFLFFLLEAIYGKTFQIKKYS